MERRATCLMISPRIISWGSPDWFNLQTYVCYLSCSFMFKNQLHCNRIQIAIFPSKGKNMAMDSLCSTEATTNQSWAGAAQYLPTVSITLSTTKQCILPARAAVRIKKIDQEGPIFQGLSDISHIRKNENSHGLKCNFSKTLSNTCSVLSLKLLV